MKPTSNTGAGRGQAAASAVIKRAITDKVSGRSSGRVNSEKSSRPRSSDAPDEIYYRLGWRPHGGLPGQHPSAGLGDGYEFDTHVPLGDGADPRRFDLRASSKDPLERVLVKRFRQTSAAGIIVVADLSASVCATHSIRKLDLLEQFTRSISYSAFRNGDSFGFYGCAEHLLADFTYPMSRAGGTGTEVANQLRQFHNDSGACLSLAECAATLPSRRSLVFLISDFFLPEALLAQSLDSLNRHSVIPVQLTDTAETEHAPSYGLTRLWDIESGEERLYFMRPALRQKYLDSFAQHTKRIANIFATRGLRPLVIADQFSADAVSRYFIDG